MFNAFDVQRLVRVPFGVLTIAMIVTLWVLAIAMVVACVVVTFRMLSTFRVLTTFVAIASRSIIGAGLGIARRRFGSSFIGCLFATATTGGKQAQHRNQKHGQQCRFREFHDWDV